MFSRGTYNYGQWDQNPELQEKIIEELRKHPESIPRDILSVLMGVPRTTLHDNLKVLEKKGKVERYSFNNHERGRPVVYWRLVEDV